MLKKIFSLSVSLGLIFTLAQTSFAFNIGGAIQDTATKTTKGVARGAVQSEYNKKLAKQKCKFKGDSTTEYTSCNLDKIISEMNAFRHAAEGSGFANDVNIIVKTYGADWNIARQRAEFLRDKVRAQVSGSWDYHVKYNKAPSNDVYFQVQVH